MVSHPSWIQIRPFLELGSLVTFIDANHCPGAVMILFENLSGPPVLHTGDARLTSAFFSHPKLNALRSKQCILVLDTTYCDPRHTFPSQEYAIQYVKDVVEAENTNPGALFLFGAYGIGKERVFLEVKSNGFGEGHGVVEGGKEDGEEDLHVSIEAPIDVVFRLN